MTKINKWKYLWVLQGNYGYGWDDLTSSEEWDEISQDYKDYRANDSAPLRIIQRRILNVQ